jgi:hypothetical protein
VAVTYTVQANCLAVVGKMLWMPNGQKGRETRPDAAAAERRLVMSWVLFPVAVLTGLAAVFGVAGRRRRHHH